MSRYGLASPFTPFSLLVGGILFSWAARACHDDSPIPLFSYSLFFFLWLAFSWVPASISSHMIMVMGISLIHQSDIRHPSHIILDNIYS